MNDTTTLTERRKADRAKMASLLVEIAEKHGALAEVTPGDGPNTLAIRISTPRGLHVRVDLEGKSIQPDIHVLPWHMHYESQDKLAPEFGDVNPYHHRKATQVAYGWNQLRDNIDRGLNMAAKGTAFQA